MNNFADLVITIGLTWSLVRPEYHDHLTYVFNSGNEVPPASEGVRGYVSRSWFASGLTPGSLCGKMDLLMGRSEGLLDSHVSAYTATLPCVILFWGIFIHLCCHEIQANPYRRPLGIHTLSLSLFSLFRSYRWRYVDRLMFVSYILILT